VSWRENLQPALAELSVYDVPPRTWRARLHANESPLAWPPEVLNDLSDHLRSVELNRYPDTSGRSLRAVLGAEHGVAAERIILGNGSDELIGLLMTAFSTGNRPAVVVPSPTFVMYAHSARVRGFEVRTVPLIVDKDFALDEAGMRAALPGAALCFFARPNNPTGNLWDGPAIRRLIAAHPDTVFVVDEAYIDYAPGASLFSADAAEHQVHMATLSKIGLAALRLGYCIASPALAAELDKVRLPYNISATTLALAERVLTVHREQLDRQISASIALRDRLVGMLADVPGAAVVPAHANFVLLRLPSARHADLFVAGMTERGIAVRSFAHAPSMAGCVRVSLGTDAELDLLQLALDELRGPLDALAGPR